MKKTTLLSIAAAIALPLGSILLFPGCESADSHTIDVYPASADVRVNQSVVLSATGWSDYTWSLDPDKDLGYLSSTHGASVTYVARAKPSGTTDVIQTIKVRASGIAGVASSSSTNSTVYTGEAEIRHLAN